MTKFFITVRYIAVISAAFSLSGCLGGGIAQQIVSSIATRMADRAIANAMDVQDGPSNRKPNNSNNSYADKTITNNTSFNNTSYNNNKSLANNAALKDIARNTLPDPYQVAFVNAAFEPVQSTAEPLPSEAQIVEAPVGIVQSSQLVRVELFSLLIGDEKNAVYEKARLLGATSLPKQREWQRWAVGTGLSQHDKKIITFLIPPEFGKLPSGSITMVELASPGELNIARYKGN